MDATISVICYKSKTLANGEHPLMLRIAQNGKSTYKSLKISVAAKHWDFERNVPKPNNPNKDLIQKIILKTKLDYQQKILEKKANSEEFTASSLINEQKDCKLPVKYVLQNRKISPDSVRFVQIRLRVGTNSIKLYQFGTDLL